MSPVADYFVGQGDVGVKIADTLRDSDGSAVDLQGATVRFQLAPIGGGAFTVAAGAENEQVGDGSDGSKGKVVYTWQAGNTDAAGLYLGEWKVTYEGGAKQTFPNADYVLVSILAAVA